MPEFDGDDGQWYKWTDRKDIPIGKQRMTRVGTQKQLKRQLDGRKDERASTLEHARRRTKGVRRRRTGTDNKIVWSGAEEKA